MSHYHSTAVWSMFWNLMKSLASKIPAELVQVLKDDAVKVLHAICQQFGKLSSFLVHRTGKGQFSFQSQRKAIPKNHQTTA